MAYQMIRAIKQSKGAILMLAGEGRGEESTLRLALPPETVKDGVTPT